MLADLSVLKLAVEFLHDPVIFLILQPCHIHVPIVLKSGSLNLLEPSGPVEVCNGIALRVLVSLTT
jgi:hypothetical protein